MNTPDNLIRRARMYSGLVIFLYVTVHLVNHSMGLISLEVMEGLRQRVSAFNRNIVVSLTLYGALLVHTLLGFHHLLTRRSFKMSAKDWTQLVTSFALPLVLLPHIFASGYTPRFKDAQTSYKVVLDGMLEDGGIYFMGLFVIFVWVHGIIGITSMIKFHPVYQKYKNAFLVVSWLLPILAVLGAVTASKELATDIENNKIIMEQVYAEANIGKELEAELMQTSDLLMVNYLFILLGVTLFVFVLHQVRKAFRKIKITYPNGKEVRVAKGTSILEASREHRIGHVSMCGGRGRCSTCRVRVMSDIETLPPRNGIESLVAERLSLQDNVRLACQLRPTSAVEVRPLVNAPVETLTTEDRETLCGREEEIVVMFVDLRGFTAISEKLLPYDTVYLLNQYFKIAGEAIVQSGGRIDKFIGDGIMALFTDGSGVEENSKNALLAAGKLAEGIKELSTETSSDFGSDLKFGIGIHAGTSVVGAMGYGENITDTAIGDCVNVASRLEQLTKEEECQLIITSDLYQRSGLSLKASYEKNVTVKGKSEAFKISAFKDASTIQI
ncbi:MAG: 2Fe-2S iron-sulfur cluster binding domain-containing protein [Marinovum sp.]|nr:2Fe-2S iron-sulfur cluster binding domain-containing protein [Marinovum sp.]